MTEDSATTVDLPPGSRSVILRVAEIITETPDAHSLVFDVPAEHADRFTYRPGQFLTLRIPSERTGAVARCYSLASSPVTDDRPKVTVKRTAGGYASNWLCDHLVAGAEIEVLPPSGVFTPKDLDENFLLFAAGSGITPIISIVKSALAGGTGAVRLVYANRDPASVIFADELAALTRQYPDRFTVEHWLEPEKGLPTAAGLAAVAAPYAAYEAFMCGPELFMDRVRAALAELNVPRHRTHAETFVSLASDPFAVATPAEPVTATEAADAATVAVELDGKVHELTWPRSKTLVQIMLEKGIDVPHSCTEGECGACTATLVSGEVRMDTEGILDPEDIADGYILGCQSHPVTDEVRIEY